MSLELKLVDLLQGRGAKVFPMAAPENEPYPLIVYQIISTLVIRAHEDHVMDRNRVQVSIWSKKYEDCVTLAGSIRSDLDRNKTDFKLSLLDGMFDTPDPEPGLYRRVLDFLIWHQEGV